MLLWWKLSRSKIFRNLLSMYKPAYVKIILQERYNKRILCVEFSYSWSLVDFFFSLLFLFMEFFECSPFFFFFFTQQQYSGNHAQNHGSIVQGYGRDCVTLARKFPRGTASHRRKFPPLENLPSLSNLREKFRFIIDLQRFLSIITFSFL